jgi:hypothetical protein
VAIAGERSLWVAAATPSSKSVHASLKEDLHARSIGNAVVVVERDKHAVLVVQPQHGVRKVAVIPTPQLVRLVAKVCRGKERLRLIDNNEEVHGAVNVVVLRAIDWQHPEDQEGRKKRTESSYNYLPCD